MHLQQGSGIDFLTDMYLKIEVFIPPTIHIGKSVLNFVAQPPARLFMKANPRLSIPDFIQTSLRFASLPPQTQWDGFVGRTATAHILLFHRDFFFVLALCVSCACAEWSGCGVFLRGGELS